MIAWQNTLMGIRQKNGKPYSPTYLKSIHSQLSAIFNYAVKYYRLKQNPAEIAGNMGKETHKEMLFWTKAEYLQFAQAMIDKPMSYYAFEMLYWCGIRMGELLALTPADFMPHNRRACSALQGIGDCVPNKRSAGSKTIALLANANCFTSALLATMVSDKLGSGEQGIPSSCPSTAMAKSAKCP